MQFAPKSKQILAMEVIALLFFRYKQKEVYLELEPDSSFKIVLGDLKQNYDWVNKIDI